MKQSVGAKTLAMPAPVWMVGTYDAAGKPNIMTIAWGGICNSQPVSVNVSLRKATYSYEAILARKAFTVSIPSEAQAAEVDYVGTVSGRDVDKFAATGLTPVRSEIVDAPYVAEAPIVIECRLVHHADLGLHTLFVGGILDVKADVAVIGEKGYPDISKVKPIVFDTGLRRYFGVGGFLANAWEVGKKFGQ
ncbi:MAG TPA: flavin reductase family protein [Candidatus Deferrimicrobiaceae bacterium]|jgi:flavin reductase (DIM6/NTAB) family NADH-FMN oxidoreductase RutF